MPESLVKGANVECLAPTGDITVFQRCKNECSLVNPCIDKNAARAAALS